MRVSAAMPAPRSTAGTGGAAQVSFPLLRDSRYPVHKIADKLEPYLRVIVEKFHPEKIILFGSQAYGQPDEHSDVDLHCCLVTSLLDGMGFYFAKHAWLCAR